MCNIGITTIVGTILCRRLEASEIPVTPKGDAQQEKVAEVVVNIHPTKENKE